jgi:hypothetical protein
MARTKEKPKEPQTQQGKLLAHLQRLQKKKRKKKSSPVRSILVRTKTDFYNATALVKPYGNQNKTRKVITAFKCGRKDPLTLSRLSDFKDGAKVYTGNGPFAVVDKKKNFAELWKEVNEASKNEASASGN